VVLLKGASSVICGKRTYLSASGSPGMATGGSGDVLSGIISKESPLGEALLGHRLGDTVTVRANTTYDVEIKAIEKCEDNGEIPINKF
jgi:hypothetical protein